MKIYGLILGLAWVIGTLLVKHFSSSPFKTVWDRYYWWLLITSLTGARLYHIIDKIAYYQNQPFKIFFIWQGGLSIWGLFLGLILGLGFISWREKINLFILTDPLALILPLLQSLGRIGNGFNLEIIGPPTHLPWGVYLPPNKRPINYLQANFFHPTFAYEAILNLILFFLLFVFYKTQKLKTGFITGLYLIGYGFIRLILEPLRLSPDSFYFNSVNINLVFSVVFILTGFTLLLFLTFKPSSRNFSNLEPPPRTFNP